MQRPHDWGRAARRPLSGASDVTRIHCNYVLVYTLLATSALSGCATHERWIERRPETISLYDAFLGEDDPSLGLSQVTAAEAGAAGLNPTDPEQRIQLVSLLVERDEGEREAELEFAVAELEAMEGDRLAGSEPNVALGYYADSMIHGYRAVAQPARTRVRGATSLYNQTLKSLLATLRQQGYERLDARVPLPESKGACSIEIELHSSRWTKQDFERFEFAEDFQVLGLRNHYQKSGLGVPLIAIRLHEDRDHPEDRYYPSKLCYPLTAFMRVEEHGEARRASYPADTRSYRLVLELHDTMEHETLLVAGKRRPLESDLTTPLAFNLDQPEWREKNNSTMGLLFPGEAEERQGLYLLEPFDPNRIPVVMVHGLWSSPATWMEMFNDLRSDPRIRSKYQFWFYLYPTGNPFWDSATQMRADLAQLRATFDPNDTMLPMDQSVLVGHSMGGLVSRLQTVDSGNDFWRIVSDRDFRELDAEPETKQRLSDLFYFRPDPSIRRVVTIGTPHRGSRFANGVTQWIGAKLISLPVQTMARRQEVFQRNPGFFRPHLATRVMTSIDSLSPDSPVLTTLLMAQPAPWVNYHNIVGDAPRTGFNAVFTTRGDGVVSVDSARLDDLPNLSSQVIVPEQHVAVHRHPQSIEEVRRVLLTQLEELDPSTIGLASYSRPISPGRKIQLLSDSPE